jgi:hypothetical protein
MGNFVSGNLLKHADIYTSFALSSMHYQPSVFYSMLMFVVPDNWYFSNNC